MDVLCYGFGFVGKAYTLYLKEQGHSVYVITANDNTEKEAESYGFKYPRDIKKFDAIIVSVPTPTIRNKQDVSAVNDVLSDVENNYKTKYLIIKSTILPGNARLLSKFFKDCCKNFVIYPEFLEAKNPIGGVFNQSSMVFGKNFGWNDEQKEFISSLFGFKLEDMTFTNLSTACMIKYIHNMWLSCNLSFWNSIIKSSQWEVDFKIVLNELHKSRYFGIHPWEIGKPYLGSCLPKDIKAYFGSFKNKTVFEKFIKNIDEVNEEVKK
jgi:nucleotide sugar dehydrogenase